MQPIPPSDFCDVDPDEVSAVYPNDDERIEEVETDRRDDEEVHGGNIWRMIAQEGPPSLAGRSRRFTMYLATLDCATSNPSLSEFAVDARRAPKRIFDADPPDQHAQLGVDLRSAS